MRRLVRGGAAALALVTTVVLTGCEATDLPLPGSPRIRSALAPVRTAVA